MSYNVKMRITRAKRYAEKHYIRETAQTPSAEPLVVVLKK
jgi:hypothetical protein